MSHVHDRPQRGFTLVELLFTMIIGGVIVTLAVSYFMGTLKEARAHTEMASVLYAFGTNFPHATEKDFVFKGLKDSSDLSVTTSGAVRGGDTLSVGNITAESPKGTMICEYSAKKQGDSVLAIGWCNQDGDESGAFSARIFNFDCPVFEPVLSSLDIGLKHNDAEALISNLTLESFSTNFCAAGFTLYSAAGLTTERGTAY